ncbi:unnamed protein product [Caenorhabditis brenneri]
MALDEPEVLEATLTHSLSFCTIFILLINLVLIFIAVFYICKFFFNTDDGKDETSERSQVHVHPLTPECTQPLTWW